MPNGNMEWSSKYTGMAVWKKLNEIVVSVQKQLPNIESIRDWKKKGY